MINFLISWSIAVIIFAPFVLVTWWVERDLDKSYRMPIDFSNNERKRH